MKATILGQPLFVMPLDLITVQALLKLSAAHYDDVCKSAGRQGGFLYGWNNKVSEPDPLPVRGSFRDLDITLKICELANYGKALITDAEFRAIVTYTLDVHTLLHRSYEITKGWEAEIEI